jgi:septal ring factor EnvC (AmiA/AmiB activator)
MLPQRLKNYLYGLMVFMLAPVAMAQESLPQVRQLEQTRKEIEASRQRHQALRKNLEEMESTLGDLQKETGDIADALKQTEQQKHEIERRLQKLESDARAKQSQIRARQKQIGSLLATVLRVSQVPPHAVLAMDNGLEAQIHASRALGLTTESIKRETDTLSEQLRQVAILKSEIARESDRLADRQRTLQDQRLRLADRVEERRRSMEGLHTEEMQEQSRIAQLTRQSKDLESLVDSLEQARRAKRTEQFGAIGVPVLKPTPPLRSEMRVSMPQARPKNTQASARKEYDLARVRGALTLPVAGDVSGRYGQQQASNDTLKGLMLATPSAAVVTAPYGGEVMFTGPFRDYGQMVIIRHNRRYHTLLAGLSRIDVSPGQFLLEGEPIGAMGNVQEDRRLYLELRENGKPVDPAPWFGGVPRLARN